MSRSRLDITQAILVEGSKRDFSQAAQRIALFDEDGTPLKRPIVDFGGGSSGDSAYHIKADAVYTESDGIVASGTVECVFNSGSGVWGVASPESPLPFARRWGHDVAFDAGDPDKPFADRNYPVMVYTPPSGETAFGALGTVLLKLPVAWFPDWPVFQGSASDGDLSELSHVLPPGSVMQWEVQTENDDHGLVEVVPAWGNKNADMFGLTLGSFVGDFADVAFIPDQKLSMYPSFHPSGAGRLNLPAEAVL